MNEDQLRIFLDVVQLGSFQQAADKNFVSQRAVSRQMQRLEQQLHSQLFVRQNNKIALTAAGEFFKKRSMEIINMLDATQHELHRFSYRGATNLTIGYFSPFDAVLITQLLAQLPSTVHPFFSEESIEHLVADVLLDNLDCAIVMDNYGFANHYAQLGLQTLTIHEDQMLIGVSKDSYKDGPVPLETVQQMPVVYYSNEESDFLKQAFTQSLAGIVQPAEVLRVPTYEQMQLLVGTGQAISFYPKELITALQRPVENIRYAPLEGDSNQSFQFKLIVKSDNQKPIVRQAIKVLRGND